MTNDLLKPYIPMVKFIADAFGENCEVILHDLTHVESSIIAIANNHITGREVGGHITDFALSTIYNPEYLNKDYIVNYKGHTEDGKKTFKSSTFYIRDEKGEPIGLFCINFEITDWLETKGLIDKLVTYSTLLHDKQTGAPEPEQVETFTTSIDDMLHAIIDRTVNEMGIELNRMLVDEKKHIVNTLSEKGVFALKGAVNTVARKLEVSEQTIYRYLHEIQV